MKSARNIFLIVATALTLVVLPMVTQAADAEKTFIPEIPIPGIFTSGPDDGSLMSRYIRAVYIFFVWIVGLLGVVMIIYGGIRWVAAAGNAGRMKEARDLVTNAIIGVMLALLSVVLLRTINPELTNLSDLSLKSVDPTTLGVGIIRTCTKEEMDGPGYLSTSDTKCGQVKKLDNSYSITDGLGRKIDTYCISTQCNNDEVCSLGVQDFEGRKFFKPGSGCIKKVAFNPPITMLDGKSVPAITEVRVQKDSCLDTIDAPGCYRGTKFGCGEIDWDTIYDGTTIPNFVTTYCVNPYKNYGCYIIGDSGKEIMKSESGSSPRFVFDTMSCSPNPAGSSNEGASF